MFFYQSELVGRMKCACGAQGRADKKVAAPKGTPLSLTWSSPGSATVETWSLGFPLPDLCPDCRRAASLIA